MRFSLLASGIQGLANGLQQQGEVAFVFGARAVARVAATDRKLPVNVHAVQLEHLHVGHRALGEHGAACFRQRDVREMFGPGPAADRHQQFQLGVGFFQRAQAFEVLGVDIGVTHHHFAIRDVGKRVVDVGELFSIDLLGREAAGVARPGNVVAHHLVAGCRGRVDGSEQTGSQQAEKQSAHEKIP